MPDSQPKRGGLLTCAGCDRSVEDGAVAWKDYEPFCAECKANGYRAAAVLVTPLTDATALLERLATDHPRAESSEGLDDACFFCGEYQEERCTNPNARGYLRPQRCYGRWQLHSSDCPWVAARKLLDRPVYLCPNCEESPKREFPFTDALDADSVIDVPAPRAIGAAS